MKLMHLSNRMIAASLVAGSLAIACGGSAPTTPTATDSASSTSSNTSGTNTSGTNTSGTNTGGGTCATGDGVNDACSCDADAQRFCAGFYTSDWVSYARANGYTTSSWKYGLIDCLGKSNASAACRASLARRETLNEQMMAACGSYCRGIAPQPGSEPCVDHLKAIYDSLSNSCRSALDAHEGAKAVNGKGPL